MSGCVMIVLRFWQNSWSGTYWEVVGLVLQSLTPNQIVYDISRMSGSYVGGEMRAGIMSS